MRLNRFDNSPVRWRLQRFVGKAPGGGLKIPGGVSQIVQLRRGLSPPLSQGQRISHGPLQQTRRVGVEFTQRLIEFQCHGAHDVVRPIEPTNRHAVKSSRGLNRSPAANSAASPSCRGCLGSRIEGGVVVGLRKIATSCQLVAGLVFSWTLDQHLGERPAWAGWSVRNVSRLVAGRNRSLTPPVRPARLGRKLAAGGDLSQHCSARLMLFVYLSPSKMCSYGSQGWLGASNVPAVIGVSARERDAGATERAALRGSDRESGDRAGAADQIFFAACSSASFSFARWASTSSVVAQPIMWKQNISCVRLVGLRPVQRASTRQAMIAQ